MKLYELKTALGKLTNGQWLLDIINASDYDSSILKLETEGDIEDIWELVKEECQEIISPNNEPGLRGFKKVYDFINYGSAFISINEMCKLDPVANWDQEYPALFRTMKVWIYG